VLLTKSSIFLLFQRRTLLGSPRQQLGGELWAGRASTVAELADRLPAAVDSVIHGTTAVLEAQLDGADGKFVENERKETPVDDNLVFV
jgi:hypothetical protein